MAPPLMPSCTASTTSRQASSASIYSDDASFADHTRVNLELLETRTFSNRVVYGDHQPSATTSPCRMIIKLCISMSGADSTASRKAMMPAGSTPWDSAELRGNASLVTCDPNDRCAG